VPCSPPIERASHSTLWENHNWWASHFMVILIRELVRMNAGDYSTIRHPDKGAKPIFQLMIHYNYDGLTWTKVIFALVVLQTFTWSVKPLITITSSESLNAIYISLQIILKVFLRVLSMGTRVVQHTQQLWIICPGLCKKKISEICDAQNKNEHTVSDCSICTFSAEEALLIRKLTCCGIAAAHHAKNAAFPGVLK